MNDRIKKHREKSKIIPKIKEFKELWKVYGNIARIDKSELPDNLTPLEMYKYLKKEYREYDGIVVYWKNCPLKYKRLLQENGIGVLNKDKKV